MPPKAISTPIEIMNLKKLLARIVCPVLGHNYIVNVEKKSPYFYWWNGSFKCERCGKIVGRDRRQGRRALVNFLIGKDE